MADDYARRVPRAETSKKIAVIRENPRKSAARSEFESLPPTNRGDKSSPSPSIFSPCSHRGLLDHLNAVGSASAAGPLDEEHWQSQWRPSVKTFQTR